MFLLNAMPVPASVIPMEIVTLKNLLTLDVSNIMLSVRKKPFGENSEFLAGDIHV